MLGRNDPCWCGSGEKWKKCHYPALLPNQDNLRDKYYKQYKIILKREEEIEGIRQACRLASHILDELCSYAKEGVTTNELNRLAEKLHREAGAIAAPLHYGVPPYPKSICTSLNEVVCHGIPNDEPLKKGDILNIDVSPILNGYYGDSSRMVTIEPISEEKRRVVEVSKECLMRAIALIKPGLLLGELGKAIEAYATEKGCSVVHQFVGHGVGLSFHEPPQVPHFANNLAIPLAPGMIFTIEPMINAGVPEAIIDPITQWIARTADGRPSAQWEHTVLVTSNGVEILTAY